MESPTVVSFVNHSLWYIIIIIYPVGNLKKQALHLKHPGWLITHRFTVSTFGILPECICQKLRHYPALQIPININICRMWHTVITSTKFAYFFILFICFVFTAATFYSKAINLPHNLLQILTIIHALKVTVFITYLNNLLPFVLLWWIYSTSWLHQSVFFMMIVSSFSSILYIDFFYYKYFVLLLMTLSVVVAKKWLWHRGIWFQQGWGQHFYLF